MMDENADPSTLTEKFNPTMLLGYVESERKVQIDVILSELKEMMKLMKITV